MAATITTGTTRFTFLKAFMREVAEETLQPNMELVRWGQRNNIMGGDGRVIFIPYFHDMADAAGVVPESYRRISNASAMSGHNYSATLSEFIKYFEFNDFFWGTKSVRNIMEETTRQLTISMAKGHEGKIQGQISAAGTYISPDGSTASASVVSATNLKMRAMFAARAHLRRKSAPMFSEIGAYAGLFHPNCLYDLFVNASGGYSITPEAQSTNVGGFRAAVVEQVAGIRIYESPFSAKEKLGGAAAAGLSASASGAINYVIAPGAYAVGDLDVMRPSIIVHGFGSGGVYDPGNQIMTVAVKSAFFAKAMDTTNRLVRIPSGLTL